MTTEITATETTPVTTTPKQSFFKFGVYLNGQLIEEQAFRADVYNPPIRNNINLRPLAPRIMSDMQYVLRQQDFRLVYTNEPGKGKMALNQYGEACHFLPNDERYDNVGPEAANLAPEGENSFSFLLKINDKYIIERNFKVAKFNPNALFSKNLVDMVTLWVDEIQHYIKNLDTKYMWEEYELANAFNLTPVEVRALSPESRELKLRKIHGPATATV